MTQSASRNTCSRGIPKLKRPALRDIFCPAGIGVQLDKLQISRLQTLSSTLDGKSRVGGALGHLRRTQPGSQPRSDLIGGGIGYIDPHVHYQFLRY
jgi:hypothetical protein